MRIPGKQFVSDWIPFSLKQRIWWLTDRDYRREYTAQQHRIKGLQDARNQAGEYLVGEFGRQVISGPFRGMTYLDRVGASAPTQKLLGTYEKELWPIIEEISRRDYDLVIDIGAAEGYYVVGLAGRLPAARIIAFEANRKLHPLIKSLARANGVAERVSVLGTCSAAELNSQLVGSARILVICDIEGAENEVLDPQVVLPLKQAEILVEVHEHIVPGISDQLLSRFSKTHRATTILSTPRNQDDWPIEIQRPHFPIVAAMDESRHPNSKWFWLDRN